VSLAPVEDEMGGGRIAVPALTRNARVWMVAGSLIARRGSPGRGRHSSASL